MNSTRPFYPILIPNSSYVKKFLHRGPRGSQIPKNLMISKNYLKHSVGAVYKFL